MSTERCAMAGLVEARRDGRLGDGDTASIERHLGMCPECSALSAELSRLTELARGPEPVATSPLERRRARVLLLQRAATPPPAPRRRAWLVAVTAAIIVASSVATASFAPWSPISMGPRAAPNPRLPLRARTFKPVVSAGLGLATSAHPEASATVATPDSPSEASPAVQPQAAPDRGSAAHGGSLAANTAAVSTARVASSSATRIAPEPRGAPDARTASSAPAREDSAAAFDEAVEMVGRGDYGAATARLEGFRKAHPKGARTEDAAFLIIVALQRSGRTAEAATAARAYLHDYPDGYRRVEAQAIAAAH